MKKNILIALVLALFSTTLSAEENSGWYMGLGYGSTGFDDDDLGRVDSTGMGSLDEDTDSGYVVYGGYKLNNLLSIEASYRDYGEFTYKGTADTKFEATSAAISANLGLPLMEDQLRPFIILGVGYISTDYTNETFASVDDSAASIHAGIGIEYEPKSLNGLGFRLAYEIDSYSVEVVNIGQDDDYTLTLSQVYAGVQYRF